MKTLTLFLLVLGPLGLFGQELKPVKLNLSDGTNITAFRNRDGGDEVLLYYYLPLNLRLSEVRGYPEISFLTFREDSLAPIDGGIMHFLIKWGLNNEQTNEANSHLATAVDSTAFLAGSVMLEPHPEHPSFEIVSDNPIADVFRRSLTNAASTPLHAGSKLAASFSFSAEDAEFLEEKMEDPEAFDDIIIRLYFLWNPRFYGGYGMREIILEAELKEWIKQLQ